MHIESALEKFISQLFADGRSEHTIGQYRRHITLLGTWLARERPGVELEQIDHGDIAAFMNSATARLRPDGVVKKANSLNALRTSLRCFFAYAHAAGWIAQNPARLLRRAIVSPGPPRSMSDEEVARLLATLKQTKSAAARRDHALFTFMLATGVRLSSSLTLRVEDLDLDRGEALLRHAKGGRTDVVYLGRKIRDLLLGHLGDRRTGVVFPGLSGHALSRRHAHRRFAMWLAVAGIARQLSPHCLRHSFGMHLYRKSRDVLVVQRALGHRSIASTMVYATVDRERLKRALG